MMAVSNCVCVCVLTILSEAFKSSLRVLSVPLHTYFHLSAGEHCRITIMLFGIPLLCFVITVTMGFPLAQAPPPSPAGQMLLVPVMVLGSYGPQMVLVPMSNTNWAGQKNLAPTPESTHTHTEPAQHHVKSQNIVEAQHVNSAFQQPPTLPSPSLTPETLLPQGQVVPVWNSIQAVVPLQPSVTGQSFIPSWTPSAGGVGGQTQVMSVVRQAVQSNSGSSEEGDATQVIYFMPVSGEIPNMGIAQGGEGSTSPSQPEGLMPHPNPNPDLDPNPNIQPVGHLLHPTPTPSAGHQENPAPLGRVPPNVSAGEGVSAGDPQGAVEGSGGVMAHSAKSSTHKGKIHGTTPAEGLSPWQPHAHPHSNHGQAINRMI